MGDDDTKTGGPEGGARARLESWKHLLTESWRRLGAHRGFELSAYLAFHLLLAVTGAAVAAAWLAGAFFFEPDGGVSGLVHGLVDPRTAEFFDRLLADAELDPKTCGSVAVALLVFAYASRVVVRHTQTGLNRAFDVEFDADAKFAWRHHARRVGGYLLIVVTGLVLFASFSAKTTLEWFHRDSIWIVSEYPWLFRAGEFVGSLLLATALYTALFRLLPDAHTSLKHTWKGAGVAAKLFAAWMVVAAFAMVYGVPRSAYGTTTWVLVMALWFYLSALSFFYGAEFTVVLHRSDEGEVKPRRGAAPVSRIGPWQTSP